MQTSTASPLHYLAYIDRAHEQFAARAMGFKVAVHLLRLLVLQLRASPGEMRSNLTSLMGSALHDNLLTPEAEGGKIISKIQCVQFFIILNVSLKRLY